MTKTMTALAAALLLLSGAAQADTVKQIWNQGLGENNPGRVTSPDECILDNSSDFACWNDRDEVERPAAEVEEPLPDPNGENGDTSPGLF